MRENNERKTASACGRGQKYFLHNKQKSKNTFSTIFFSHRKNAESKRKLLASIAIKQQSYLSTSERG